MKIFQVYKIFLKNIRGRGILSDHNPYYIEPLLLVQSFWVDSVKS